MEINDNLVKAASEFSKIASNNLNKIDNKENLDKISYLSTKIIKNTEFEQNNHIKSHKFILDDVDDLYKILKWESIDGLEEKYQDLVKIAISTIKSKTMNEKPETALEFFFNLDILNQCRLLDDSQFNEFLRSTLLELGPNYIVEPETTLFSFLADSKNFNISKFAIDLIQDPSFEINKQDKNGDTPLHLAAKNNNLPLVEALIAHKADPLQANDLGKIPFDVASWDSGEALAKAIPMDTHINGKPFGEIVMKWASSISLSSTSPVFPELVAYLRKQSFEEESLQELTNNWDRDFLMGCLMNGYLLENIPKEKFVYLCSEAIEYNKVEAIKTILTSGKLPFSPVKGTDFFTAIESNNSLKTELRKEVDEVKKTLSEKGFQAYQSLAKNLQMDEEGYRRAVKIEEIDHSFQILIEENVPGAKEAKDEFDEGTITQFCRLKFENAKKIFELDDGPEAKAAAAAVMGKYELVVLKNMAWKKKDIPLLSAIETYSTEHIYTEAVIANKIIVNLALDKMIFKNKKEYEGGDTWVAQYFTNLLKSVEPKLSDLNLPEDRVNKAKQVLQLCIGELQDQSLWANDIGNRLFQESNVSSNRLLKSKELLQKIDSLQVGDSCIIIVNSIDHATLMRIEKTNEKEARILFYNTGLGLENHPKGDKPKSYQTFIEYLHVPIENFHHPDKQALFKGELFPDMPEIYKQLESLSTGGVLQPPSNHQEYFETIQVGGSCAYQSFLAMIRERIVRSLADPQEGLGLYKAVKGIMHSELDVRTKGERDEKISNLLQPKLKIFGAELRILNNLEIPAQREVLIKSLVLELRAQNLEAVADEIEQSQQASTLNLFSKFKKAINQLSLLESPLIQDGLVAEVVQFNKEKVNINRSGFKENLDDWLRDLTPDNINKLNHAMRDHFITKSRFTSVITDWIARNLTEIPKGPDDTSSNRITFLNGFINAVNRRPLDIRRILLNPILDNHYRLGNLDVAAFLIDACGLKEIEDLKKEI